MPTVPLTPPPEPHQYRQIAESFGSDVDRYDRTRPHYPDGLIRRIVAASPGRDILDVGIGTGIAARQFQAAGGKVLGIEPDARMADFARRNGTEVEVAKIEDWDPAGRTFDTVVAGQAWHWVDPVAGAVKAAGVLRPGGRLAVFWNVHQPPPDLAAAFADLYRRVLPESIANARPAPAGSQPYGVLTTKAADGIRQAGAFGDPELWRFDWDQPYTRDEWLDVVPTQGGNSHFPAAQLDELLAGMGAVIDAMGGSFTMHYATVAVTAAKA